MIEFSQQVLADLIGETIPKGSIPAAWWVTTCEEQLASFDRWRADYRAHVDKVEVLAATLGLKASDAMLSSFNGRSILTGFNAPHRMNLWPGHAEHIPVPAGWRIDPKKDRLVPSRKTKADRESQANKDFTALKNVPDVQAYVTGLPMEIYLDDRSFGGTIYRVNYRRGENCLMAFTGGDPDRSPDTNKVDETVWYRQKLSVLIALREQADDAARTGQSVGREITS
jgi:hypothetical protein